MPPREVYSVDFSNGNMTPVTSENWGALVLGGSTNGSKAVESDVRGIQLHMTRDAQETEPVTNCVYVLPPEGSLPLDSRFRVSATFETPSAQSLAESPSPPARPPENWAVALKLKFTREVDLPTETYFAATCQFGRAGAVSGVRVNGVRELQADAGGFIDSPLDYRRYRAGGQGLGHAPQFDLELNFCGIQAGPLPGPGGQPTDPPQLGHAVASALLSIDGRADHRVLSTSNLSTGEQPWIGAIGVCLATIRGVGEYRVRLRRFAISRW